MRRDEGEFQDLSPSASAASARRTRGAASRVESEVPEIRPRSVPEMLDVATEVFRSRFGAYVGLSTLLWLPVYVARPILAPDDRMTADEPMPNAALLLGFLVTLVATIGVSVLNHAIVARLVAADLGGRPSSVLAAVRGVLARSFAVVVLAAITSTLTATGLMCLCVPGFFVAWKLYLAPVVCVVEDAGIGDSVSRSVSLSSGRFGPWLGLVVVGFFLALPFSSMSDLADQPDFRAAVLRRLDVPALVYDTARIGFSSLFTAVATAFHGVLVAVWYYDCLARRDGADLESRLGRLKSASSGALGAV